MTCAFRVRSDRRELLLRIPGREPAVWVAGRLAFRPRRHQPVTVAPLGTSRATTVPITSPTAEHGVYVARFSRKTPRYEPALSVGDSGTVER
ncbi:hypothetical protein C3492_41165 [Streptomyces sp. Ru62]|nr:hypothetical protein C3492_41165 [Streptomyces sp. Ru62]